MLTRPVPRNSREPREGRERPPGRDGARDAASRPAHRPRDSATGVDPVDHHGDASGSAPQPPREDRAG